ncbi:PC4 domain-containing protein [Trichonephila clavipes]|nr:PC4 domain-containing protein [Trichonephila clavipes]
MSTVFIENIPTIIFQRYFKKKGYSKKFVPGTCVLGENNWLELQRIHKNLTESAMWLAFDEVELMLLTTSLIELLCDYLGNSITDVFKCYGCAQQYGNQLGHACITMDYETLIRPYGDLAVFTIDFEQLLSRILSNEIFKC